jgi:transcriptional regulator with XRE-family HTH domain
MKITNNTRALILNALRTKGLTQTQLAEEMGYGKAWVTRLLDGTLKRLKEEQIDKLQDFLGIKFFVVKDLRPQLPPSLMNLARIAEDNETLMDLLTTLEHLLQQEAPLTAPYIPTKNMTKLGQEIIRLAYANEDKPGKVAREVLRLLSQKGMGS